VKITTELQSINSINKLTNMEGYESTLNDPRFKRGITLLKEKRYEEAVAHFEDLLRTM